MIEYNVTVTCMFKKKWQNIEYATLSYTTGVAAGESDADLLDRALVEFRVQHGLDEKDQAPVIFYRAVPNKLPTPTGPVDC